MLGLFLTAGVSHSMTKRSIPVSCAAGFKLPARDQAMTSKGVKEAVTADKPAKPTRTERRSVVNFIVKLVD